MAHPDTTIPADARPERETAKLESYPDLPPLSDWKRYGNIIIYRTYAELKSEAQINHMGYIWWILEPLLNTVLFYFILVAVLERAQTDALSFVLIASITWQWFNVCLLSSAGSIFDATGILKHVYLPKVVLPLIVVISNTWKFLFVFALLLIWLWCTGSPPQTSYLALPLLFLCEFGVILALSLPLAALIPYFPDARVAVDALLRSLMLVSGIFFQASELPPAFRPFFHMNPMAVLIESYRRVLLHGLWPDWSMLAWVMGFSAVCGLLTYGFYARIDRTIVKAIHR